MIGKTKQLTAYERLQNWRTKQYLFNKNRFDRLNLATSTIFTANILQTQKMNELAARQAAALIVSRVNKLV